MCISLPCVFTVGCVRSVWQNGSSSIIFPTNERKLCQLSSGVAAGLWTQGRGTSGFQATCCLRDYYLIQARQFINEATVIMCGLRDPNANLWLNRPKSTVQYHNHPKIKSENKRLKENRNIKNIESRTKRQGHTDIDKEQNDKELSKDRS